MGSLRFMILNYSKEKRKFTVTFFGRERGYSIEQCLPHADPEESGETVANVSTGVPSAFVVPGGMIFGFEGDDDVKLSVDVPDDKMLVITAVGKNPWPPPPPPPSAYSSEAPEDFAKRFANFNRGNPRGLHEPHNIRYVLEPPRPAESSRANSSETSTMHAILIGVRQASPQADPAANAIRAISSMRQYVEGSGASSGMRLCFLSSDVEAITRGSVTRAFDQIEDVLADNDTILVMFAGHGSRSADNFTGWLLSGGDMFSPDDLRTQWVRYRNARWIVISNCCYGDAITEPISGAGQAAQRGDQVHEQFQRLAGSAATALTASDEEPVPKDLITIAGAAADDTLSDGGQLLLATLLVGSALGQLTYFDLNRAFGLVRFNSRAFVARFPDKYRNARVLTWDPPPRPGVPFSVPTPAALTESQTLELAGPAITSRLPM